MQRSVSRWTSNAAFFSAWLLSIDFGVVADMIASHAASTLYAAERRGAFKRDTASLRDFFVWVLNTGDMSGKGGSHLRFVPKSPCVPITASQDVISGRVGCKGAHMCCVSKEAVATGGQSCAVTYSAFSGNPFSWAKW